MTKLFKLYWLAWLIVMSSCPLQQLLLCLVKIFGFGLFCSGQKAIIKSFTVRGLCYLIISILRPVLKRVGSDRLLNILQVVNIMLLVYNMTFVCLLLCKFKSLIHNWSCVVVVICFYFQVLLSGGIQLAQILICCHATDACFCPIHKVGWLSHVRLTCRYSNTRFADRLCVMIEVHIFASIAISL